MVEFMFFMLGGICGIIAMSILSVNSYNKGYKDGCKSTLLEFEERRNSKHDNDN